MMICAMMIHAMSTRFGSQLIGDMVQVHNAKGMPCMASGIGISAPSAGLQLAKPMAAMPKCHLRL